LKLTLWNEFVETVSDLLENEKVKQLRKIEHHLSLSCYEHSVFVAYMSFCLAKKLGADRRCAARAGLLHDLYLYDTSDVSHTYHCFNHANHALLNARTVCDLSGKEENIILSHMWPLSRALPRSCEAVIVTMCDKYCASAEFLHIWQMMKIRRRLSFLGA